MNTNIRFTLSASTALGLVSFVVTSALVSSLAAPATLVGFGLLAVYGMVEIAIASYASPRSTVSHHPVRTPARRVAATGAVLAFPMVARPTLARAA